MSNKKGNRGILVQKGEFICIGKKTWDIASYNSWK